MVTFVLFLFVSLLFFFLNSELQKHKLSTNLNQVGLLSIVTLLEEQGRHTIPVFSLSYALFSLTCRHPVIDLLEWHAMGHQVWVFKFVQMSDLCWCFFCSVLLSLLLLKETAGQCWLYSSVSCWPLNHQGL